MKAISIVEFGDADVLNLVDCPRPTIGAGEVLIRAAASGVNPVDWKIREGRLKGAFPHEFPLIPGWEVAGVIAELGDGVTGFTAGESVWAYARKPVVQGGTYAEYVVLPHTSVAHMPEGMLFHEAAAVPLAGLTAWQCLFDGDHPLRAGQTVLIHAAAGGVGHMAVQFAKSVGATVIGTAGPDNQAFVQALGTDQAINYRAADFCEAIRKEHPNGIDLVLDT